MEKDQKGIAWGTMIFILTYQLSLLIGLPFYFIFGTPTIGMAVITVALVWFTGISITGGYHRFYSHRTYKTNKFVEAIYLLFATMALQGSALRWSFDHRRHHAYVDTDKDPYSIKKGFLYAHILWLFEKSEPINPRVVPDLMKNQLVVFQHKYYNSLAILTNLGATVLIGWLMSDYLGAFVLALWLRLFILHHFTWFINSLAHFWGAKTYSKELSAVDNYVISLFTFGEGYHNYHHAFATDYRNGIKWYHFDPTKWLVWTLSKVGMAKDLNQINMDKVKKRVLVKDKDLLLEKVRQILCDKAEVLEQKVHELYESAIAKITEIQRLRQEYQQLKKDKMEKSMIKEVRQEMKKMKKALVEDWKAWLRLSKTIMKLKSPVVVPE